VLPSEMSAFSKIVAGVYESAFAESIWQIGALDGRMRMFDNAVRGAEFVAQLKAAARSSGGILIDETDLSPEPEGASSLMQRVKQQLDPLNTLPYFWSAGGGGQNTHPPPPPPPPPHSREAPHENTS
jgi:hypothetical protein